MKSFFKKLSLVLVAAMVITMLPAQSAKAATKVALGPVNEKAASVANTAQTYELKVGDEASWTFYGVVDYNASGRKTKLWTSSNPAVATVANGKITAVAVGKTKITLTVTNNGIDYIGQADLTVVAKEAAPVAGAPVVKQVAWNAVEITFATNDEAKAAKDKVKVTRVKTDKTGRELDLFSGAKQVIKDGAANVLVVSNLANEVDYKFVIPGYSAPYRITMSSGEPVAVKLYYPPVYISAIDKVTQDVEGNPIKYPEVTPLAQLVDTNGIIVEATNATGFKYSTDKTRNVGNPNFTPINGRIRFNKLDSSCYVKCEYSYKGADGKTRVVDYDEATVAPQPYTTPNFQGFVEKITLTDTEGKEVEYPTDYSYSAEIAIGQKLNLAFYFETPEGTKYVPSIVSGTVVGTSDLKKDDSYKVIKADGYAYNYYVIKDNKDENFISFKQNGTKVEVTGFKQGPQTLCIYEKLADGDGKENPTKDKLVGIINITVRPKAEIVDMHLSENSLTGYKNTQIKADQILSVGFKLEDQYGVNTVADIKLRDENGSFPEGVFFAAKADGSERVTDATSGIWRSTKEGYICINTTKFDLSEKGKTLVVSIDDQADPLRDNVYVTNSNISTTTEKTGYALMVSNMDVYNSSVSNFTSATDLKLSIDVVNTKDSFRYDPYVEFYVIGDDDITQVKGNDRMNGKLLVWITREDGTVLKKTVDGAEFPLASEIGTFATSTSPFYVRVSNGTEMNDNIGTVVAKNVTFDLDLISNATPYNFISDGTFLKGRYSVQLYKGEGTDTRPSSIDSAEVVVNDALTRISQWNTGKEIEASTADTAKGLPAVCKDGNNKDKKISYTGVTTGYSANKLKLDTASKQEALVMDIVKKFYVWVDADSNGKCVSNDGKTAQTDEVKTIANLLGDVTYAEGDTGEGFVPYSFKYVMGANGSNEIYITSVTIRFRINGAKKRNGDAVAANDQGALVEQTLDINQKFVFKN